jgi:hypothetical protein
MKQIHPGKSVEGRFALAGMEILLQVKKKDCPKRIALAKAPVSIRPTA